jgi:ribosomal-protein-alanine N-acetyltransferase
MGIQCAEKTISVPSARLLIGNVMLPIETERLVLRKYEDRDAADILEFSSDADYWLVRNLDWPVSEAGVRAFWERQRDVEPGADPKWLALVVELKAERKAIGSIGIGVRKIGGHRQGTIGWLLGLKYQKQGLATEAAKALVTFGFDVMGLHRIYARTNRDNTRSWLLMARIGMRQEAHSKESHIVKGERHDEVVYAVLADEWKAGQDQQTDIADHG